MRSREQSELEVTLIYSALPFYRQDFIDYISKRLPTLKVLSGPSQFDPTVTAGVTSDILDIADRNHYLLGRRLLWQSGILRAALHADVLVMELNPRVINTWLMLVLRTLRSQRTVLWGHAWPRRGKFYWSDRLRSVQRRLASRVIVYTYGQAEELRQRHTSGIDVAVAPNSIYAAAQMWPSQRRGMNVIFSGRLVREKKPMLLLDAFRILHAAHPKIGLVFIGDGPEMPALKTAASALPSAQIDLIGEIRDFESLRDLYSRAFCSVSPGYVGLSITQTLGFGVPMIFPDGEPHAPEVECATEMNSQTFPSDDATALAECIATMVRDIDIWDARRDHIAAEMRRCYSVEAMGDGFIKAVES